MKDVCREAGDIFTDLLTSSEKNTFIVPGGKTPQMFYRLLAQQICNWGDTILVLSDERLVQENTPESNIGMIKRNLLNNIRTESPPKLIPVVNGFPLAQSSNILEALNFSTQPLLPPKAAFLGIGTDGHTASLFPGDEENFYSDYPFLITGRPDEPFQRISVSMKVLIETPLLVFLAAGKGKMTVLEKIVNECEDNVQLPIQSVIKSAQGRIKILCDQSATPK